MYCLSNLLPWPLPEPASETLNEVQATDAQMLLRSEPFANNVENFPPPDEPSVIRESLGTAARQGRRSEGGFEVPLKLIERGFQVRALRPEELEFLQPFPLWIEVGAEAASQTTTSDDSHGPVARRYLS